MKAMPPAVSKPFRITLITVWILITIAGAILAPKQHIPMGLAMALWPALLLEAGLYLVPGFPGLVERLRACPREWLAAGLVAAAAAPYILYSVPMGTYQTASLLVLVGLSGTLAYWWLVVERGVVADVGFLCFVAVVMLSRPLGLIYASPLESLPVDMLGKLMWIRTTLLAALLIGRVEGTGLGFWPSRREWKTGATAAALFLPVAVALGLALKFAHFRLAPGWAWKTVPLFFGMFWVVAFSEEFLFRGLLQQWLSGWTKSARVGLVLTSMAFGSVHLWFRDFPNWKFAILAGVAGLFYGWAYEKTGSVRASMVAHAAVNVFWRVLMA
jgi:membrane protease YdiL (CAAX protease family)